MKIGAIQTGLSKKSLFWLLIGLFASLVLVTIFYIVGNVDVQIVEVDYGRYKTTV